MIDIAKLMETVGNYGLMDESIVKLNITPKAKISPVRIVVRSKHGAGARAGQVSKHSCSIKVKVDNRTAIDSYIKKEMKKMKKGKSQ